MDSTMKMPTPNKSCAAQVQGGFTLLEAIIATAILTIGLVTLLAVFAAALSSTQSVQWDTIARQKATETLESIYTARETSQITFDQIQNESATGSGIFVVGMKTLTDPGPDGLDGTDDDVPAAPISVPGSTGSMTGANASTKQISLGNFQRQIQINNVNNSDGSVNANLRQITVTVQYLTPQGKKRSYSVQALISSYR
jgi:Tfp pilus assembly protein PilV